MTVRASVFRDQRRDAVGFEECEMGGQEVPGHEDRAIGNRHVVVSYPEKLGRHPTRHVFDVRTAFSKIGILHPRKHSRVVPTHLANGDDPVPPDLHLAFESVDEALVFENLDVGVEDR